MTAEMAKGCEMKVKNTQEKISIELIIKKKDQEVDIRQVFKDILTKPKLSDLQIRFTKDGYTFNKNEENGLLNSVPEIIDILLNFYGISYQSSASRGNKEDQTDAVNDVVNQQDGHSQSINETSCVNIDKQKKSSQMQKNNVEKTHFGQNEFDNKCKSINDKEKGINTKHSTTGNVPCNSDGIRTDNIVLDMSSMEYKHSDRSQECHGEARSRSRNPKSAEDSGSHQETCGIHHRNNTGMNETKKEQDNANENCGERPEHYIKSATCGARKTQGDTSENPQDNSNENLGKMPKDDVESGKNDASEDDSNENPGNMPKHNVKSSKDDASEDTQGNSNENPSKLPKDNVGSVKYDASEDDSNENPGKMQKAEAESGKDDTSENPKDNFNENTGKMPKDNVRSVKDDASEDTQDNSNENPCKTPKAEAESGKDDPKKKQVIPNNDSGENSKSKIYPSLGESRKTKDITEENRGKVPQNETRLTTDCDTMKLDHSKGPSGGTRQHRKH